MKKGILIIILAIMVIGIISATTWFDAKVKCPVCGKTNTFREIGSYGSYIYDWPEKLEYIYWPVTESSSLYSCSKCKLTLFMWDFSNIGKDTLNIIKSNISNLALISKGYDDKMTSKLESAELIYGLYNKDPEFWCRFYRIKGYHYSLEGNPTQAKVERLKALSIADSLLWLYSNMDMK